MMEPDDKLKVALKKPCDECPFRRKSLRGWLGPWNVEELLFALGRQVFPCHKTIRSDDTPVEEMTSCAGAAIFLNNKVEWSRHPINQRHQELVKDVPVEVRESVFANGDEFRAHHAESLETRMTKRKLSDAALRANRNRRSRR
jgi:hypothetical protein